MKTNTFPVVLNRCTGRWTQQSGARLTGFWRENGGKKTKKKPRLGRFCIPAPINWVMNSDKLKWPFECNKTLSTCCSWVFLPFLFFVLSGLWSDYGGKMGRGVLHLTKSSCRYVARWPMTESGRQRRAPKARFAVKGNWKFSTAVLLRATHHQKDFIRWFT